MPERASAAADSSAVTMRCAARWFAGRRIELIAERAARQVPAERASRDKPE